MFDNDDWEVSIDDPVFCYSLLDKSVFEMNITNLDKMTFIIGKIELLRALRSENEAALLETNILP